MSNDAQDEPRHYRPAFNMAGCAPPVHASPAARPVVTSVDHRAHAAELQARIDAALKLLDDWREHAVPFQYRDLWDALNGKPKESAR